LVSPGAATDGVTLFFLEKMTTFLVVALWKVMTFFLAIVSSPFLSSHVVYPVFFLNSATKTNFIRVSLYSGVTPGWYNPGWSPALSLVTPLL